MKPLFEEKKKESRLFEEVVIKSWWVILFFLISYFIFDQGMKRKNAEEAHLQGKLTALNLAWEKAEKHQEELKLEIASQDDPAWIELTLMRCLGLIPEGDTKVYFKRE